ncbi:heavy-metal-associated domain-containing protein [Butyrivibrio sp. YAB3001]|uniref:heavy-metal-associated domain-containing protein n=1 Tax=Butyrivibrio sp. YAB3001 TaxID=1520812 RepID=UPI0008F63BC6|nr:heavy metal-associated domain-containing protein [Butyrivibrio sp. YAB3001]SFC53938.1 Copper chaperone CopZ [Butyrivibrio sp. YAB3001]
MISNIVSIIVLILIISIAISGSIKHFKGEGGCCGQSSTVKEPDKKLNNPVIGKRTFFVEGMHCENCRNRVKRTINSIDGASCKVNLKKGRVDIEFDREIDDDIFIKAIENLDFHVVSQ